MDISGSYASLSLSVMRKVWKCPRDVIQQCVRSSYCSDNLFIINLFCKRNTVLKKLHKNFDISCIMFSKVPLSTVKILKIGTPEIITIIVLQLEQLDFTVQYCVQKMQTE